MMKTHNASFQSSPFRPMRRAALLAAAALLTVNTTLDAKADIPAVMSSTAAPPALMPLPASSRFPDGALPASGALVFKWGRPPVAMLARAAARYQDRFEALIGAASGKPVSIQIETKPDPGLLTLQAHEGYTLSVSARGVKITAQGPTGVLRGLATLMQLLRIGPKGAELIFAEINDTPRFPWRGVMVDTSRHFVTVKTLERQIDAMELLKLNVLHLHLSDGTGFRVESRVLPELTAKGSHGEYYTQAQLHHIVAYAADRGIRVVPEFDVPGHALALLLARPDLASRNPVDPAPKNKNNAALDPTLPATLALIDKLYAEMAAIFPDRYFHAGGDEVNPEEWTSNPTIVAYMKKNGFATVPALQATFTARVEKILSSHGKIMVGWDEVSEAPIPKNVVVEAWRSSKFISSATNSRHPVIVAVGYYLDLMQPAAQHYLVDPYDPGAVGLNQAQADRMAASGASAALVQAFLNDPPPPPLNDAQKSLVLGGEAPLWAEIVTDEMLDARLWPRSATIAERLWSPPSVHDINDMYRRLDAVNDELNRTGLQSVSHTRQMIKRLAPQDPDAVLTLASAIVPIQNYRLNAYVAKHGDHFDEIAEIASPDPHAAIRFNALAARYAAGDHDVVTELKSQLKKWQANDTAFTKIATVRGLTEAIAVSHDVATLAGLGLAVLNGDDMSNDAAAHKVLETSLAQLALSKDPTATFGKSDAPQAGVMIAFAPGVKALLKK